MNTDEHRFYGRKQREQSRANRKVGDSGRKTGTRSFACWDMRAQCEGETTTPPRSGVRALPRSRGGPDFGGEDAVGALEFLEHGFAHLAGEDFAIVDEVPETHG